MQALILAGGSGTRFWPLSRRAKPKQLLNLEGKESLLEATVERLEPLIGHDSVWICTTAKLAPAIAEQLPSVPREQILAEPTGRDTAAAIGWSVHEVAAKAGDGVVAVLPADHRMGAAAAFRDTLEEAGRVALAGQVVALGVEPRWAETGYGYLELGETLDTESGLRRVTRFTEKPDAETAARFVESGNYRWNGGIFVFKGSVFLEALERHQPELAAGLIEIGENKDAIDRLYRELPRISVDFGVMEKLDDLVTLPLDCEWSDLGGWAALSEILPTDADGNAVRGDVLAFDSDDSLFFAEEGTIAAIGVSGLVVVKTGDAVLVIPRERAQEVRRIIKELKRRGSDELL